MLVKEVLFVFALLGGALAIPINKNDVRYDVQKCAALDSDKINIHLVPHSHDDVGWQVTPDQYFYESVQYIITSTVEALKDNPQRRFVQVETAFFWMWWKEATEQRRQDFINLVENGQIEMIGGAWSMNDEACANYQSTVDQFTWGLRILNDTIGPKGAPKIGWQVDPFGHSREQASIYSQLGFDGVFFARLDNMDRETRKKDKTMDFLWQGSANLDNSVIFGNAFPESLYYPPGGFCWDCGDAPIIDDPESFDYNVIQRASDFLEYAKRYSTYYSTNNVLVPMGGDFQYQSAEINFINLDKLIKAFKNSTEINVIYSTPSCYIKAVNDASPDLKLKTDDFFPYGSDDHSYWAGYFTSRPNSKRFERESHRFLQAIKQLASLQRINGGDDLTENIRQLREAMGVMQHHDAITGTEKQAVTQNYVRLLDRGLKSAEQPIGNIFNNLLPDQEVLDFHECRLSNVSICETTTVDSFTVAIYNPLSRKVSSYVRLPVDDAVYTVQGPNGEEVVDVVQPLSSFTWVQLDQKPGSKELVFLAKDIPALGANIYTVTKNPTKSNRRMTNKKFSTKDGLILGTDDLGLQIDLDTDRVATVWMNGKTVNVSQELMYYEAANGDNNGDNKASGAYIFRPLNSTQGAQAFPSPSLEFTYIGELVDEVKLVFSDWASEIIRVYKGDGERYIEFDYLVGPIEVDETNGIGKEVISRFTIDGLNNAGVFYTDSNGRELIKRQRDKRYDYEYDPTLEPIASNYYPITSKIVVKDEDEQLEVAILNDRSQGGSSLKDGQVELMLHRRLLKDDAKGVSEPLNEQEFNQGVVVRGQHYLVLGSSESSPSNGKSTAALERELALKKLLPPVVLVSTAGLSTPKQLTTLQKDLPDNVNILTLEPWKEDSYILRLEHILEKNEDATLSQNVTVDLDGLFSSFSIDSIRETTLAANKWLDDYLAEEKYEWKINGVKQVHTVPSPLVDLKVDLVPMQIRTFIITVKKTK